MFVSDFLSRVLGVRAITLHEDFMESSETNVFHQIHTSDPVQAYKEPIWEYAAKHCKVVVPLRHPYENAVSSFARYHANPLFPWANWNVMMQTAPKLGEIFWVDIDTEYRRNMMDQLCSYLERTPKHQEQYDTFVNEWAKKNRVSKSNPVRKAYNETGVLPHGPKYEMLDEAVAWYSNIKENINKQYAPGEGSQTGLLSQSF